MKGTNTCMAGRAFLSPTCRVQYSRYWLRGRTLQDSWMYLDRVERKVMAAEVTMALRLNVHTCHFTKYILVLAEGTMYLVKWASMHIYTRSCWYFCCHAGLLCASYLCSSTKRCACNSTIAKLVVLVSSLSASAFAGAPGLTCCPAV